jgi:hypothetical protein
MSTPATLDTESARAFMEEALAGIDDQEIDSICEDVARKSRFFQAKLNAGGTGFSEADVRPILRSVFTTRRRADQMITDFGADRLRLWILDLVDTTRPLDERIQAFDTRLEGLPDSQRFDLATELLHFTHPDQYWLWTRWMWDPRTDTGALTLIVSEDFELSADSLTERYRNVGRAVAFVQRVGEAAGFRVVGRGPFATDVYLSFVYVIYVYTVLRMRMTQEFNRVMPELPEFSRRLLGIKQPSDYAC